MNVRMALVEQKVSTILRHIDSMSDLPEIVHKIKYDAQGRKDFEERFENAVRTEISIVLGSNEYSKELEDKIVDVAKELYTNENRRMDDRIEEKVKEVVDYKVAMDMKKATLKFLGVVIGIVVAVITAILVNKFGG